MLKNFIFIIGFLASTGNLYANQVKQVSSVQRMKIVGSSLDGKKLAVRISYFGPSSGAPFAQLLVKEAGVPQPLLFTYRFMLAGGESELTEVEKLVMDESREQLKTLGISTEAFDLVNVPFVASQSKTEIAGSFDAFNGGSFSEFNVQMAKDPKCKAGPAVTWKLCVNKNCVDGTPEASEFCGTDQVQMQNIYRSASTVWFFTLRRIFLQPDVSAYWVDFSGI